MYRVSMYYNLGSKQPQEVELPKHPTNFDLVLCLQKMFDKVPMMVTWIHKVGKKCIRLVSFHYLLPHLCGNQVTYQNTYQPNMIYIYYFKPQ